MANYNSQYTLEDFQKMELIRQLPTFTNINESSIPSPYHIYGIRYQNTDYYFSSSVSDSAVYKHTFTCNVIDFVILTNREVEFRNIDEAYSLPNLSFRIVRNGNEYYNVLDKVYGPGNWISFIVNKQSGVTTYDAETSHPLNNYVIERLVVM